MIGWKWNYFEPNMFYFWQVGEIKGVKIIRHDLFTNDVLYAEVVFDMRPLKPSLLPLVPLFW
jgi:Zn-dependent M16 (insulinase) family peptidase